MQIISKLKENWPSLLIITCSFFLTGILSLLFPAVFTIGEARLKDQLFHLRYALSGREKISPYLVHVVFDDESLASLESSPRDREVYGEIIEILKQAGARSIACDIFFQHMGDTRGDELFINAVKQAQNIYFPVIVYEKSFSLAEIGDGLSLPAQSVIGKSLFHPVVKKKGNPYTSEYILTPFDRLFNYSAGTGHINCSPDIDGINRAFPLIYQYKDGFIPALTLKMAVDYLDVDASKVEIAFGKSLTLKDARLPGDRVRDITIPVDDKARAVINYVGPRDDSFYEISVKNLLASRNNSMLKNQLEDIFEGTLVLISDTSVQNKDVGPGIFTGLIPYSDILVTLTNMLLTENFLKPISSFHFFIILFVFSLLLWYSSTLKKLSLFLLTSFVVYLLFWCYCIFLFLALHSIPVLFFPAVGFLLFLISASVYQYSRQKTKALLFQNIALKEQKEKENLTKLDGLKTDYIDNLIHDLKNLLQLIKTPDKIFAASSKKKDVTAFNIKSEEIQESISKLLEVAKMKAGIAVLKAREIDLVGLLNRIYQLYKPHMAEKGIRFLFTTNETSLKVYCDPGKIKRVVHNLLSNALKYTERGGSIEIILPAPVFYTEKWYRWEWERKKPGKIVTVSVKDTGSGIKKEELAVLFHRFCQKRGTGIGLSIAREYIILHYGHIDVQSTEGSGSVFTFYLPCGKEHLNENEIDKQPQDKADVLADRDDKQEQHIQSPVKKELHNLFMNKNPVVEIGKDLADKEKSPGFPFLVVDDNESILIYYRELFVHAGYNHFILCKDSRKVLSLLYKKRISALFLDLSLPYISGMELLVKIKKEYPDLPVIVVTGTDKAETAALALKSGAYDYLVKPLDAGRLFITLKHVLKENELMEKLFQVNSDDKKSVLVHREAFTDIITNNSKMIKALKEVEALAQSTKPVLITGEPGVGKELVAHAIHKVSKVQGKFIKVNIAGLDDNLLNDTLFGHVKNAFTGAATKREGLVPRAHGGTLFLDEIGELSMASQVKLLRLIQEKEYYPLGSDKSEKTDVRIIAATNADLFKKQQKGEFRRDLADRLGIRIHIPPLRQRPDDIKLLLDHFLEKAAQVQDGAKEMKKRVPAYSRDLIMLLSTYSFPGNVRELENMVEYGIRKSRTDYLSINIFREKMRKTGHPATMNIVDVSGNRDVFEYQGDLESMLAAIERAYILKALKEAKGNKSRAARNLGMDIHKLKRRLKKFKLE